MTPQELITLCESEGGFMILTLPRERLPQGHGVRIGANGSPIGFIHLIRDDMAGAKYHVVARFDCKEVARWMLREAPLNDSERERLEKVVA